MKFPSWALAALDLLLKLVPVNKPKKAQPWTPIPPPKNNKK